MSGALPVATPEELDLCPSRLAEAYRLLDKWTEPDGPLAGAAIGIGRRGRMLKPYYSGAQSKRSGEPIRDDGVFLVASLTKPLTYLAALMLVERGECNLSDRVIQFVPEFGALGKRNLRLQHLFTHTSGLPDMLPNNRELRSRQAPLDAFVEAVCRETPLAFTPGTQVQYQSMGTLIVAEVVQRLSGQPLAEFLRREIFEPLGLQSTSLGQGALADERIVEIDLTAEQESTNYHWNTPYWRRFGSPWGGLFSTPQEYGVLCQAMLESGQIFGRRLWAPRTIKLATTNRLHDYPELPESLRRTRPWGLGWQLNHKLQTDCLGDLLSETAFGHIGATGALVWIDRQLEGFCNILTSTPRDRGPWRLVRISNMITSAFLGTT